MQLMLNLLLDLRNCWQIFKTMIDVRTVVHCTVRTSEKKNWTLLAYSSKNYTEGVNHFLFIC